MSIAEKRKKLEEQVEKSKKYTDRPDGHVFWRNHEYV